MRFVSDLMPKSHLYRSILMCFVVFLDQQVRKSIVLKIVMLFEVVMET